QLWLITGANGAGKSALAAVLVGYGDILAGHTEGMPVTIGWVSFEAQAELIQAELKKDNAD
ncbi:MAG TPA: molybdenum ABC transporter ATP-binding protein, partial [Oceanospirillaceae bacterium]|nr:molybdenum ABC transporter ATP-binding protein [Oceanospirillaceae bacterium]